MSANQPVEDVGTGDRFAWPLDPDGAAFDDSKLGELPSAGPLADFLRASVVLSQPPEDDPSRPWVLAAGERVLKAYDLRAFNEPGKRVARAEAEAAASLSDVPGVVTTYNTGEVGSWLVIEMQRLGETVADHLAAVANRAALPLARERWAQLLEAVSQTLAEIHRRGITHHDVKPANLMFDRGGEHLIVGDFSIASRQKRRATPARRREAPTTEVRGTNRYIAPEQFVGRVGPNVDQYALGVTATEILGNDIPEQARQVLLRATSQDPCDRYPTVADFGVAVRAALDDTAPRRLSSRLQRVKPAWRHAWGPGLIVALCVYAGLFVLRIPDMRWTAGLGLPILFGAITALVARALSRFRGSRTQPRIPLADRAWFPVLVFAVLTGALWPLFAFDPQRNAKYVLYSAGAALVVSALLGSLPRGAGSAVIHLVRGWEQRRERHRGRRIAWWGGRAALLAALGTVSWLPVAVGNRWPREAAAAPARAVRALTIVGNARAALLASNVRDACRIARVPASSATVACDAWAPLAARWMRQDAREGRGPRFVPAEFPEVSLNYLERGAVGGAALWSIRTRQGDRLRSIGTLERKDAAGRVWEASITRASSGADDSATTATTWNYEVVRRGNRWVLTSIEVCDYRVFPSCVHLTQLARSTLPAVIRRGLPG